MVSPAQDPSKEHIWTETKKRLERFLPSLFVEIFPEAAAEEKPASVPEESSPAVAEKTETPDGAGDITGEDAQPSAQKQDQGEGEGEKKTEDESEGAGKEKDDV